MDNLIYRQIFWISPIAMGLSDSVSVSVCLSVSVCIYLYFCLPLCLSLYYNGDHMLHLSENKNAVCRCSHLPSKHINAKIAIRDLDLLFEGKKTLKLSHLLNGKSYCKNVSFVHRFWHWPSNLISVTIVLRDIYLLFESKQITILVYLKP